MTAKNPVHIVTENEGHALSVVGDSYRVVMSGKQTNGAFAVIEMLVPPGGGPGPHAHAEFQETFHVLDGQVELKSASGSRLARKGDFVQIPGGGIVHCFKNTGTEIARLWCVVVPAGLEAFFEEIGTPGKFGTFEAPIPLTDEVKKKMEEIAGKYGQQLYPPDYLDK